MYGKSRTNLTADHERSTPPCLLPSSLIRFLSSQATDLFDTILETQPRGGGGGGKSREDIVTEMSVDLLSKVPVFHPPPQSRSFHLRPLIWR
jgi:hypothetical protein